MTNWRNGTTQRTTWDNLQFSLRLGQNPRQLVTTTPRRVPLLKDILEADDTLVSVMRTDDNRANLAAGFFDRIIARYEGTALGRQELDGLLIEEREGALWTRALLERHRSAPPDDLARIVVALDPPVTGHAKSDACGIIVAGIDADGHGYVLQDATMNAVSPERWSGRAVELYHRYAADRIVVETNQGGDMAESVLRAADPTCAVRQVKATRGKYLRAEPVAHLYERGLVTHCGDLGLLEDEMCDFTLDGLSAGRSPDRLDALVWALTDLMLNSEAAPPGASTVTAAHFLDAHFEAHCTLMNRKQYGQSVWLAAAGPLERARTQTGAFRQSVHAQYAGRSGLVASRLCHVGAVRLYGEPGRAPLHPAHFRNRGGHSAAGLRRCR